MSTITPALASIGITSTQLAADLTGTSLPPRYRTPAAVEALRRARAQRQQTVQPRTYFAPILPPTLPIAIATEGNGKLQVDDLGTVHTADDSALLDTLAGLGVNTQGPHRTLLIDSTRTAHTLHRILRSAPRDHPTAPILDWWLQRLDYPGTGACYLLTEALTRRFVTGETARAEAQITTWHTWLNATPEPPATSTAELAKYLSDGGTLPGLLDCHESDQYAWKRMTANPGQWWTPDTRHDAAMGLLTRSHATEYYNSLLREDPLYAQVALRAGYLITGTVTRQPHHRHGETVEVRSADTTSRFRIGDRIEAWNGRPENANHATSTLFRGTIHDSRVGTDGNLHVSITDLAPRTNLPTMTDVTLCPRRVDPFQQRTLTGMIHRRLTSRDNLLNRTAAPAPAPRDVPMDVLIAAADDE